MYLKKKIFYSLFYFQTVEEHRRVIESEGTTITTIRRVIGDSVHEIKTKSDLHGLKEKEENFLNMDESKFHKILDFTFSYSFICTLSWYDMSK